MANPYQNLTIADPGGAGGLEAQVSQAIFVGPAAAGTNYEIVETNDPDVVVDTFTRGPIVNAALYALALRAGPIRLMKIPGSVAGSASAVTASGGATSTMTVTGTPDERLSVRVECTTAGALNAAYVKYSLDYYSIPNVDPTWSEPVLVPTSGEVTLEGTPLTVDFTGALALGETHDFTTIAPFYSSTETLAAFAEMADPGNAGADLLCFCGDAAAASGSNTIAASLGVSLQSMWDTYAQYVLGFAGASTAAASGVPAALSGTTSKLLSLGYGTGFMTAPRSRVANNVIPLRQHEVAAVLAALNLISTDLARVANGAIPGMLYTDFEAFAQGAALDTARVSTFRKWTGFLGYYINNQRMLTNQVSDFRFLQHARCMATAARTAWFTQLPALASVGLRTNANGTIDAGDRSDVRTKVLGALSAALLEPTNAEGKPGHVSAVDYSVNGAIDLNTTGVVETNVSMRPLGYPKAISTTLRYTKKVG